MRMAVGTLALATFLLVACSGPQGPQGQAGMPGADWTSTPQDISFSQLLSDVDQGRVRDVLIQGPEIHGTYMDGRSFQTYAPSDPSLVQRLYNKGVQITARPQSDNVPLFVSLLIVALIGVWMFLSRQMQAALSSIAHAIEQISALPVPRA